MASEDDSSINRRRTEGKGHSALPLLSSATRVDGILRLPLITDRTAPRLAQGTELLGPYLGTGLREVPYLVRTGSGHVVQLTGVLYRLASEIDGHRGRAELAARLSVLLGRPVSAANVGYLVTHKLEPLGIVAGATPASAAPSHRAVLPFRLRRAVVPERAVSALAGRMRVLFTPPVVIITLAALVGFDIWLAVRHGVAAGVHQVLIDPLAFLLVTSLLVLSGGFHELGHAAGCRYGGAKPGRLGVGFYLAWPVFYSDVTDSYRLGRAGRLRTDLGGVYFNAVAAVVAAGAYLVTGYEALTAFVLVQQIQIAQQFMPFVRLDGYYVVADLAGVPDPFARLRPVLASLVPSRPVPRQAAELRPGARAVIAAWALLAIPLLGLNLWLLVVHAPVFFEVIRLVAPRLAAEAFVAFSQLELITAFSTGVRTLMLLVPLLGLAALGVRLGGVCARALGRLLRGPQSRLTAPSSVPGTDGAVPPIVEVSPTSEASLMYVTCFRDACSQP